MEITADVKKKVSKSPGLPPALLSRKEEITEDFMKLVDKHINDMLKGKAERRYHAQDFAKLLFIHPRHLTNTIHLTTNQSPCAIMEDRLIFEMKKLLLETDMSVADIGAKFNFNDAANFIKFFKGMVGTTPLKFRKNFDSPHAKEGRTPKVAGVVVPEEC